MDQPAIYSETVRKRIVGVWRLAFGVRKPTAKRLKTGAAELQKEHHRRRAEFFALPITDH
jgi:hypothetical protein